jgi:hypothetical protein
MTDDEWDFGQSFIQGRPPLFPQTIQTTGQKGQFTQPQMMDQKWGFGQSFIQGQPPLFLPNIQVMGQEGQLTLPQISGQEALQYQYDDKRKDFQLGNA